MTKPQTFEAAILTTLKNQFLLMRAKQKDYGPNNVAEAGLKGIAGRTRDKVERLDNLFKNKERAYEKIEELVTEYYSHNHDSGDILTVNDEAVYFQDVADIITAAQAQNESVEDTGMDIANYGTIFTMLLNDIWGNDLVSDNAFDNLTFIFDQMIDYANDPYDATNSTRAFLDDPASKHDIPSSH